MVMGENRAPRANSLKILLHGQTEFEQKAAIRRRDTRVGILNLKTNGKTMPMIYVKKKI